jgi:hypothetical protein
VADVGINFRATSGYVTDGAGETYDLGNAYPQTRGGVTFGWADDRSGSSRDRNSGNDRRLAGLVFANTTGTYWRLDLPSAGTYDIYCACGDASATGSAEWLLQDTTTTFKTLTDTSVAANSFVDATDVELTHANWPGSNAPTQRVFSTTQLRFQPNNSNNERLSHVRFADAAVGGGFVPFPRPRGLNGGALAMSGGLA